MRIGIVPGSPKKGGIYQYSLSMIDALDPVAAAAEGDDLVALTDSGRGLDLELLVRAGWRIAPPAPPASPLAAASRTRALARSILGERQLHAAAGVIRRSRSVRPTRQPTAVRRRPELAAWHSRLGIDLMLYPSPTAASFEAGTPYVAAIHDLQHRLQPEFPEVSANGEAEGREYVYRNAVAQALLVIVDSEVGKEDLLDLYGDVGISADRVKVLPFVPPPYLLAGPRPDAAAVEDVRRRYALPERYLFYPARFWPHKNHARLVEAVARLRSENGVQTPIVFSGGGAPGIQEETQQRVIELAATCGVEDLVHYLGYIPNEDVGPLYAGAAALTMPTFFGPTNIPVLEAWAFGCPVLTSDIRGIREQVGEAALLVDPRSVESLAETMLRLWTDIGLRRQLVAQGRRRLAMHTAQDFSQRLRDIVHEAKALVDGAGR